VIEAVDGTKAEVPDSVRLLEWHGTELADIDPAMLDAVRRTGRALHADSPEQALQHTPELAETHAVVMAYEAARTLAAEARRPES
jgi:hypothetical protein